MDSSIKTAAYAELLSTIKARIASAQYAALKVVNKELISMYWDIGRFITERQQSEGWGKSVVEHLAKDLQSAYPGARGYSSASLWRMRSFYEVYARNEKLAPLVREIAWSKNLIIMEKCKDDLEREFYIRMTRRHGWTKNVLIHQIENQTYKKTLLNQSSFEKTVPEALLPQAKLALKDEYTFDFLELADEHSEHWVFTMGGNTQKILDLKISIEKNLDLPTKSLWMLLVRRFWHEYS